MAVVDLIEILVISVVERASHASMIDWKLSVILARGGKFLRTCLTGANFHSNGPERLGFP